MTSDGWPRFGEYQVTFPKLLMHFGLFGALFLIPVFPLAAIPVIATIIWLRWRNNRRQNQSRGLSRA